MRKRAYIAGPITKGDLAHNVNQATEAFIRLAKAGIAPLCPHWSVYSKDAVWVDDRVLCVATANGNAAMEHADWMGVDLPWVEVSHAVLRLPGVSTGADAEVECAKANGVPVFESVEDVIGYLVG